MESFECAIRTPEIRLDGLLKFAAVAGTGGEAKWLIQGGQVCVNGETETRRSRQVGPGDRVVLIDEDGADAVEILVTAGA